MKKILLGLAMAMIIAGMILPQLGLAQEEIPQSCIIRRDPKTAGCPTSGDCPYETNKLCGMCCLLSSAYYISDWFFTILFFVVIFFTLMGALDILTAAGDSTKFNNGKNRIMYAAIGLGVAILAKAVPAFVKFIVNPGA